MSKRSILLAISCLILISSIASREIRVLQTDSIAAKGPKSAKKQWYNEGTGVNTGYANKANTGNTVTTNLNHGYNNKITQTTVNNGDTATSGGRCQQPNNEVNAPNNRKTSKWNNMNNAGTQTTDNIKKWHYNNGVTSQTNTVHYQPGKWPHKNNTTTSTDIGDGSKPINITGLWPKSGKYDETVFVDIDTSHFYEYTVASIQCYLQIKILDQNLKCWQFEFRRENTVVLIDAYNRIILAQQVSSTGAILSLWVIQIIYSPETCTFTIDSFPVNSIVDDEFYYFNQSWSVGEILEFNPVDNWIAITKITVTDLNVYKINVGQRLNTLLTVGWFYFSKKEQIDGGNSKVLYDKRNDELMIDQGNCRLNFTDPTIYKRIPICSLVKLPIYPNGGTTSDLVSSYFQYISKSKSSNQLTTFLYQGYGNLPIINPAHLKSTCPIIYKSDDFSFFAAITDCDIYLTTVDYNEVTLKYDVFSGLLSKTCFSASRRAEIVRDWTQAIEIVFVEGKFYLLTKNKFIVYSDCPIQWNKVYENDCIYSSGDATVTLFKQIKLYLKKK